MSDTGPLRGAQQREPGTRVRLRALPHAHSGMVSDGTETEAGRRNRDRVETLHAEGFTAWQSDGLNSLTFHHLGTAPLQIDGRSVEQATLHRVRFT